MRKNYLIALLSCCLIGVGAVATAFAQDPGSAGFSSTPSSSGQSSGSGGGGGTQSQSKFLGGDVPFYDPSSDTITWDGRVWNINNNRLFDARFDKFLNAPESEFEAERAYQAVMTDILDKLSPYKITPTSTDAAFRLLAQASGYEADGQIGDALANQVYSAWLTRRANDRLMAANDSLEKERERLEWNARMTANANPLVNFSGRDAAAQENREREKLRRDMAITPMIKRMAEVEALKKVNQAKKELAEVQVKIEFQALLVQLFFQRRFQHVLIGTRFYRSIFNDGDSKLRLDGDAKNLFAKTTGLPPTLSTLDAFASEAVRDVNEGMRAFEYLLEQDELASASKRLAETFVVGEFLPSVRLLPREKRRQVLLFKNQANQLMNALEVKDYTLAEELVRKLTDTAKDFDSSKPMAAIETSKQISLMHLAKARNAAVSGDKETLEKELKAAAEIWPRNPALSEVSEKIFQQGDLQARALMDFDQLIAQKNFRQIFDDRMRFIAAVATDEDRQEQLKKILDNMMAIEGALERAKSFEQRGDAAGAWESVERTSRQFPEDVKLNAYRADLTAKAADFVATLRQAEDLEERKQYGSALACYLKARRLYPLSEFAGEGITRITRLLVPDAT